ncbi:MAG: hypothetical protein JXA90_09585 [Planctomycetes bacterium]|nr:hypothetical protein [Planctomycetota bacterium]
MIASFFQGLEAHAVRYLLISGQAAVLYGASTFSEDIDLWVSPEQANLERLRLALRAAEARYHKLTPPMEEAFARKGHAFHFVLPDEPEAWLDVMGVPPRSRAFEAAASTSKPIDTHWGLLPTISIEDLVEIKKTQRLDDYPVISRLVLSRLSGGWTRDERLIEWAVENLFTLECLSEFLCECIDPHADAFLPERLRRYRLQLLSDRDLDEELETSIASDLGRRIFEHQQADRLYWKKIIEDLRQLRREERLVPPGERV